MRSGCPTTRPNPSPWRATPATPRDQKQTPSGPTACQAPCHNARCPKPPPSRVAPKQGATRHRSARHREGRAEERSHERPRNAPGRGQSSTAPSSESPRTPRMPHHGLIQVATAQARASAPARPRRKPWRAPILGRNRIGRVGQARRMPGCRSARQTVSLWALRTRCGRSGCRTSLPN